MRFPKSLSLAVAALPAIALAEVSFAPEHPGPKEPVSITFRRTPPGTVDGASLVVYAVGEKGRKDRVHAWEYSYPANIGDPVDVVPSDILGGAVFLVAYVDGTSFSDTNNHRYYTTVLYGRDGKPLPGAWEAAAEFAQGRAIEGLSRMADEKEAAQCIAKELEAHPDRVSAQLAQLLLEARAAGALDGDAGKKEQERVAVAARELYEKSGDRMGDSELAQVLMLGGKRAEKPDAPTPEEKPGVDFAERVRADARKRFPKGEVAWQAAFNAARREKDDGERAKAWREFIKSYPKSPNVDYARGQLVGLLLGNKDYAGAGKVARETPAEMLPAVLGPLSAHPETAATALELVKKALDHGHRRVDPALREAERKQADASLDAQLLMYRSQAQQIQALASLKEAAAIDDTATEPLTAAIKLAETMEDADTLAELYRQLEARSPLPGDDVKKWEEAYKKSTGDKALPFAQVKAAADEVSADKARREMGRAEIHMPAPGFELRELATGNNVSLASLRGKVVVVDFWATWCGPCRASFPSLQKVQEKYASNPDVVILTVNTWERNDGAEREEAVKKFVADKKLPFRVLMDKDAGGRAIDAYMVSGIPTKFFIDRNGDIRFTDIGFEGEAMVRNVSMKIDALLAEKPAK